MWLQPLADKFARLVLQLLARSTAWLAAGMDARSVAAAGAANDTDPAQPSNTVRATQLTFVTCSQASVRSPHLVPRRTCGTRQK